jgi:uncharacterized OsmC-like protein
MHIKSEYKGNLRTYAQHVMSGNKIITDAPIDNHGKGETFSPTDLVAAALTSCMMTIIGIEADKLNIQVDGLTAETSKIMRMTPRTIERIEIVFDWPNCSLSNEHRDHLKSKALTCPVALSLRDDLKQKVTFNF